MEILFAEYPVLGIVLLSLVGIVNTVLSIVSFKRTGVLKYLNTVDHSALTQETTVKNADAVQEDLKKLIEYHEKTAADLRKKIGGDK